MTEDEWLTATDPEQMYPTVAEAVFRSGFVSERKRFLFGAACCRLIWPLIAADRRCSRAVEHMENSSAPMYTEELLDEIYSDLKLAARHPEPGTPVEQGCAANLVYDAEDPHTVILYLTRSFDEWGDQVNRTRQVVEILRDITGNPFRPVAFDPMWRSESAVALASAIYAERAFDRMPILADALEEAGCDHPDILTHCRDTAATHVRGCWVVDLLLGKS